MAISESFGAPVQTLNPEHTWGSRGLAFRSNIEDSMVTGRAKVPLDCLPFEFQWIINPQLFNARFAWKARTEPRYGPTGRI
jgi:hypothetical protein